ncbi:MAG: PKD domain-containing protein [Bacteroidetes bacterium]|nr:PKD domain-containing protein [Bacteroidota bacterium]
MNADDTSSCSAPLTVNFTSNAAGASGYMWNFGDGNTSTSANPAHTYTTNGTFTVTLGVSNSSGCVNSQTLSNQVSVGALQADFDIDSNRGCTPLTVHFTNGSTSNVPITSYFWSFGDGTFSSSQNPIHIYNSPGQFTPVLIVQNADGCVDSIPYAGTIDVGLSIIPSFTASPLVQCVNQLVTFTDNTVGVPGTAIYLWDFGDGQTSNLTDPDHFYSDTGTYDVTLTITNQGCSGDTVKLDYILIVVPKADFYFDFDCANPTTVSFRDSSQGADTWLWEFGDGSTDNIQNPTHTYATQGNYTVTLIVSNILTGCVDSIQKTLPIGTPDANFTADTTNGCFPLTVHFADTSTFASGWLWSFGDGAFSNQQNPTHTYSDTGSFTVTLMINPGDSCNDSIVRINYIKAYGIKGFISATPTTGCLPLQVAFRDSSQSYLGNTNSWKWYFGTGDSSSLKNPSYLYTVQGPFQVRLTVKDNHGCKATLSKNVVPRNVEALFTSDTAVCPGESVQFDNNSTNSNQYEWYFGDGTTSTVHNPNHTYTAGGVYTVTLIAKNTSLGCTDTLVLPNFMNVDTPIANFYPNSNFSPCPPFPVQFTNTTNRQDLQWLWYFDDGDTSTEKDPLHFYFYPGDYDVALVAWDSSGCRDSIIYIDLIRVRGPVGNFTISADSGCVPLTVHLSGTLASDVVSSTTDFGDGFVLNDSVNVSYSYTRPETYEIICTLYDSLGCKIPYHVDTIVVGLIPYPDLPNDTTVCRGNYVQFDLPYGDFFDWQANLSPNYLSCTDCRNPICSAPDTITYIVTATTNIGCQAKDTITVNVDALPLIFPGISFRICPNDTLQLSAGAGVAAATWSPNLFITDTTIVNPKVFPPDTQIYRVTGTNSTGCSISRIVKVWLIDKVVADLSLADTLVCDGGDIQFMLNVREASFNDTSFLWSPAAYLNSTIIEDPLLSAPVGDYNYTVIVSSSTCIADTETVHVTIAPNPYVEAGDDQTVSEGTQIQLYAASPDNVNYLWYPVENLSCTSCRRPFLTATQSQHIPVEVTNTFGCKDTAYVDIKVVSCDPTMVFVPNTFTPNNDDLNDMLFVRGIGLRSLEYFRVYNRWGLLVYESKNISEGWDGRINGKEADVATYVYLLKGICSSGNTIEKSGNVTLVR